MKYNTWEVAKNKKRDRICNELVQQELGVKPVRNNIKQQQLKWFEYLVIMEEMKGIWHAKTIHKNLNKIWNIVTTKSPSEKKTWDPRNWQGT